MLVLLYFLVLNAVTFGFYAFDKRAAKRNRRRVPENALHFLALLGGWPSAILAQQTLRHKTQKRSFRIVFWITVAVNVAALVTLSRSPIVTTLAPPNASSPSSAPSGR